MQKPKSRKSTWTQDPDGVRADILETASEIFAEHGLAGARIDEIVRRTQSSKRMIYYYFGDKNGLYLSVLEAAYAKVRAGEDDLKLEKLDPLSGLKRLVEFTFDYHCENPKIVRLVMIENIHNAQYLEKIHTQTKHDLSTIGALTDICERGVRSGAFNPEIDPVEMHWLITSSCFFNISNSETFSHLHGSKLFEKPGQERLKNLVVDAVLGAAVRA